MFKFVRWFNLTAIPTRKGFSIAEVVIIIAIVAILTALAVNRFSSIRQRQSVETAVADIISTLNKASSKTLASYNSTNYGVHFEANAIVVFSGTTYSGNLNDPSNDPYTSIVSPASITNVTLNGSSGVSGDFYFNRLTGVPSKTGTITVTAGSFSRIITIGATGQVSSS